MIKIGLNNSYCVNLDNNPYLDKHLTVTMSDFGFFNLNCQYKSEKLNLFLHF